ncbi:MAG TPA: hypothetical protein VEI03_23420 [Stellaceae bacterium]|nr:hypothetical protein [Stellaceae bacterium]
MASTAPKRMAAAKKSSAKKKKPAPVKKATPSPKKPAAEKKPVPPAAKPAPAAPRLATPLPAGPAAAPAVAPARPAAPGAPSADEKRRLATRKFFARLRSLEAIVGADLRKRGSLVLMQAVDQWYSEATSATATDVSITTAAKAVITHL